MGILTQSNHNSNIILNKSKIPDYARDYRNEYLFIRGINIKTCGEFVKKLDVEGKKFNSPHANKLMFYFDRFLKSPAIRIC